MTNKIIFIILTVAFLMFPLKVISAIDPNAEVVQLRQSCAAIPDECFELVDTLLTWISVTRQPDVTTPLLVNIGPGEFVVPADKGFCDNGGYTTYSGAGQDNTILTGGGGGAAQPNNGPAVVGINDCFNLTFTIFPIYHCLLLFEEGVSVIDLETVYGQPL